MSDGAPSTLMRIGALADTDGDGADDYLEYVYGSDGTDPTSVP